MNEPVYYITYTSRLSMRYFLDTQVIHELCEQAHHNNQVHGVTGFLLFRQGRFLQYIEGQRDAIKQLYSNIQRDPRNVDTQILLEGTRDERLFDQWAMHCVDLAQHDSSEEMSRSFAKFDPQTWGEDKTCEVLHEIKHFYEHSQTPLNDIYPPQPISYVGLQVRALARQHSSFMMLQVAFLLAALCVFGVTYLL